MSGKPHRTKSRPSAKTRVRKIDADLLSSQYLQSQSQSQLQQRTPVRKNATLKAMVSQDQTIFSPVKGNDDVEKVNDYDNEGEEVGSDSGSDSESDSSSEENDVIEIDSSDIEEVSDSEISKKRSNDELIESDKPKKVKKLTNYNVPLNTKNWQQLPPQVHSELSTLLHLLIPPSLDNAGFQKYSQVLQSEIIEPIIKKFSTVYLPPVHKNTQRILNTSRTSGDFNLTTLHDDQTRLTSAYDINSKQLDMLALQLSKEKEMLATEKKYLSQLKEKSKLWQRRKANRLSRMENQLGPKFSTLSNLLDLRKSGANGADDIDLVTHENILRDIKSDNDSQSEDETDSGDEAVNATLKRLNNKLDDIQSNNEESHKLHNSLMSLYQKLQE